MVGAAAATVRGTEIRDEPKGDGEMGEDDSHYPIGQGGRGQWEERRGALRRLLPAVERLRGLREAGRPGGAWAAHRSLLRYPGPARVAYIGSDGDPRVLPVSFWWTGPAIVFRTEPSMPKVAALRAHPNVAITIDTFPPARSLLLRGTASVEIVDGVAEEYLAAAAKSSDGEELAEFEKGVRELYDQQARITVTPTWIRFYDFGEGLLPESLRRVIAARSSA